jgi:cell division protein FtsQ
LRKKKALKVFSAILLLCALLFVAYEILHVRNITVTGCETRTKEEIVALSGLEAGVSIFSVDTVKAADALMADPYIKPVSVMVIYPDCVNIEIEERKPAAYIKKDDALLIMDDECWLLEFLTGADIVPYPQALGLSLDELNVGQRLGTVDEFQLDVLSKVLIQAKESNVSLLSVDVSYAAGVVLTIKEGYTVELGDDTHLEEKFELMKLGVKEIEGMGKTGGIIDVASALRPYYREK